MLPHNLAYMGSHLKIPDINIVATVIGNSESWTIAALNLSLSALRPQNEIITCF